MSHSLRDQLLGLGFKEAPREPRRPPAAGAPPAGQGAGAGKSPKSKSTQPGKPRPAGRPRTPGEIDLARAYALRAQQEKQERIAAERQRQEQARLRREARARLEALLQGRALNAAEAEHVRHFEYGGKIKRVHVTAEQLKALNAGQLGVVQLHGRYLLVDAATLAEAEAVFPEAVALKVDPQAPAAEDPYADPRYQVPDDLVW
ncbi:DUF2058 domain-containing protein [Thermomonas flagellata]|uniref:DUF2058 domain-containing protein n=1 Tax=Thermomonas flagellata TaxID=2888524 RepID=UPI001F0376D7|nr:DUF2058 family protein [Thermomonas flagellata]